MEAWVKSNVNICRRQIEGNPTHDLVLVVEREMLPLEVSAEFGAYLNTIRSALDILACAVAQRCGITRLDDVYFPVARDITAFVSGDYKGHKFIERLPTLERQRFEYFKPYKGGDSDIWSMHHLDIERKHRRLLFVEPKLATFSITGWGLDLIPVEQEISANGETPICFIAKRANHAQIKFTAQIAVNEPALGIREQAWYVLQRLSTKAYLIISSFDDS